MFKHRREKKRTHSNLYGSFETVWKKRLSVMCNELYSSFLFLSLVVVFLLLFFSYFAVYLEIESHMQHATRIFEILSWANEQKNKHFIFETF